MIDPTNLQSLSNPDSHLCPELKTMLEDLKTPKPDYLRWIEFIIELGNVNGTDFQGWHFAGLMSCIQWHPSKCQFCGPLISRFPQLGPFFEVLCGHLADIELNRNELEEFPRNGIRSIKCMPGDDRFVQVVRKWATLSPGPQVYNPANGHTYSSPYEFKLYLLMVSRPTENTDMDAVATELRKVKLTESQLYQICILNPYWAPAVARVLEVPGLEQLALWFHAHEFTSPSQLFPWTERYFQYLPDGLTHYSVEDFVLRKFDFQWLERIRTQCGNQIILNFLNEVGSTKSCHLLLPGFYWESTVYLAHCYLGYYPRTKAFKRAETKRHQDSIYSIGLIELLKDAGRNEDISQRMQLLKELRATRKKVGSQRRENEEVRIQYALEALAYQLGLKNTYNYWWQTELEEFALLTGEPQTITLDDLAVKLNVHSLENITISASRKGIPLKAIPAAAKKDEAIKELIQRQKLIATKIKEFAYEFERAMISENDLPLDLFLALRNQPLLMEFLQKIVWLTSNGDIGILNPNSNSLKIPQTENAIPLNGNGKIRPIHPVELDAKMLQYLRNEMDHKQIEQPFKQINREIFGAQNSQDRALIINEFRQKSVPAKILGGLTRNRDWRMYGASEPCEFRRSFAEHNLIVCMILDGHFFSSLEDSEESLHLESLTFRHYRTGELVEIEQIPSIVFSESIRDVTLFFSKEK